MARANGGLRFIAIRVQRIGDGRWEAWPGPSRNAFREVNRELGVDPKTMTVIPAGSVRGLSGFRRAVYCLGVQKQFRTALVGELPDELAG